MEPESFLLGPTEGPAARVLNAGGRARAVLICEHASRFIPAKLDGLGLSQTAARSHAAWDIGAFELAVELCGALDAPLVYSRASRLVYDCNRPPEAPDAIPVKSEVFAVPGNVRLTEADRDLREAAVYLPFRELLSDTLNARLAAPLVITIHSFTPVYLGQAREVELGILHDTDDRAARALLSAAEGSGLHCALNEPYSAADGVTHTLREHAIPRGLPNVMVEIRNDLLADAQGVNRMAGLLTPMLLRIMRDLVPDDDADGR
ncbi:N-formylglutamate amidohydrolase [Lutimaribacter marinistellae]